jgi:hypothetical protein
MTESNVMDTISIERLHSIEREREEIVGSVEFQKWMKELGVSRMWIDPSGSIRAGELNAQYTYSPKTI